MTNTSACNGGTFQGVGTEIKTNNLVGDQAEPSETNSISCSGQDCKPVDVEAQAEPSSNSQEDSTDDDDAIDAPPYIKFVRQKFSVLLQVLFWCALVAYSLWAYIVDFQRALPLMIIEATVATYFAVSYLATKYGGEQVALLELNIRESFKSLETRRAPAVLLIAIMVVASAFLVEEPRNLVSALGLVAFVLISYLTSWKPNQINWRPVLGGVLLQYILGLLILKSSAGFTVFEFLGDQVTVLLNYTYAGSTLVYGYLADPSLFGTAFQLADGGEYFLAPPLYFNAFSTIFFVASLVSICYFLGIISWIMKKIGYVLALVMGTSSAETLSTAANIFLGQSDAPLVIKNFMDDMTDSELHAVMTGGFASVAGSALAAYASLGISATHLLSASVMSAPAALAISKVVYPETKKSKTAAGTSFEVTKSTDSNIIEAAASGANLAIQLVLSIGAQLIAFLALVAMLDGALAGIGSLIDVELSFSSICGYLFYPFAWLMGVEAHDCLAVASLLGTKVFLNEFVAYTELAALMQKGELDQKSIVIATYALCGFSNFGSIGIQLGSLTPLAPSKAKSLTKLVLSAMIAGNAACWMTACIAGLLYDSQVADSSTGASAFTTSSSP